MHRMQPLYTTHAAEAVHAAHALHSVLSGRRCHAAATAAAPLHLPPPLLQNHARTLMLALPRNRGQQQQDRRAAAAWKQPAARPCCAPARHPRQRTPAPHTAAAATVDGASEAPTASGSPNGASSGPSALPNAGSSYQWSWTPADGTETALGSSPFDQAHPLDAQITPEALSALLRTAAASDAQPSTGWMAALCAAAAPGLDGLSAAQACAILQHLAAIGYCPPGAWQHGLLQPLGRAAAEGVLSSAQLAEALWSLSNLACLESGPEATEAIGRLLKAAKQQLQDFFGPNLAKMVCAAGTLAASGDGAPPGSPAAPGSAAAGAAALGLDAAWATSVLEECEYQLVEFSADFEAFDLARMALGLSLVSDLGAAGSGGGGGSGTPWPEPSSRLRDALLKTVYARTRTIEEKAAVDYSLARLDAKGKRSMHYDPRWTHEELNWLPRWVAGGGPSCGGVEGGGWGERWALDRERVLVLGVSFCLLRCKSIARDVSPCSASHLLHALD